MVTGKYTIENWKILFNMHQIFCCHIIYDILQPTGALDLVLIGQFITDLEMFHHKYIKSCVFRFIGEAPVQRKLEIFAAIVKLVILFDAILDFTHFKHNPTLMVSRYGLYADTINTILSPSII